MMIDIKNNVGIKNYNSKLKESDIQKIFDMRASGMYPKEISEHFNVGHISIGRVLRRDSWKHVVLRGEEVQEEWNKIVECKRYHEKDCTCCADITGLKEKK